MRGPVRLQPASRPYAGTPRGPLDALQQLKVPLVLWAVVALTVLTVAGASLEAMVVHGCFLTAFALALRLLDRPLLDPLQFVACLFYWWLGVGPILLTVSQWLASATDPAQSAEDAVPALAVAAFALLGYALATSLGVRLGGRRPLVARWLGPESDTYGPSEAAAIWIAGIAAFGLLRVLVAMGIQGIDAVNFLGGRRANIWWVGVIDALTSLRLLGLSALVSYVVAVRGRWKSGIGALAGLAFAEAVGSSVLTGWKGGMMVPFAIAGMCWVSRRRRLPWLAGLGLGACFLLFVEPFVASGRIAAQQASATTPQETAAILAEHLQTDARLASPDEMNLGALFRGIAPVASEITRRSTAVAGPWGGDTWIWAAELVVPRAFHPGKREGSVGNFFARELGVDPGVSASTETSLAVTLLFEAVGNFGWVPGVVLFSALGLLWGAFCASLLSPDRLATHPFAPVICLQLGVFFEGALGAFLPALRDCVLVLGLFAVVRQMVRR